MPLWKFIRAQASAFIERAAMAVIVKVAICALIGCTALVLVVLWPMSAYQLTGRGPDFSGALFHSLMLSAITVIAVLAAWLRLA